MQCLRKVDDSMAGGAGRRPVINVVLELKTRRLMSAGLAEDQAALSAAERGGVGVCGAGRHDDAILDWAPRSRPNRPTTTATTPTARERRVCTGRRRWRSTILAFPANPFGLYHVLGNVWEWVEDCYHDSYKGAPTDGSAWTTGDCSARVLRGGSWFTYPGTSARRAAAGSSPTTGTAVRGSGSPGRLPLECLPLYFLGVRGRSPRAFLVT